MYIPSHFNVTEPATLKSFIEENAFATLITHFQGSPFASHLPVLHEPGEPVRLLAHMARANPQWRHFENEAEVLLIFHGPHAYISPFWYETQEAVPTWNYAAVHAYGRPKIIDDQARSRQMVEKLTRYYEGDRSVELFKRWSPAFLEKMMKGIVAFEVEVTRLEGKFKLGQNRSPADIASVISALNHSKCKADNALAEFMKQQTLGKHGASPSGISPPSS